MLGTTRSRNNIVFFLHSSRSTGNDRTIRLLVSMGIRIIWKKIFEGREKLKYYVVNWRINFYTLQKYLSLLYYVWKPELKKNIFGYCRSLDLDDVFAPNVQTILRRRPKPRSTNLQKPVFISFFECLLKVEFFLYSYSSLLVSFVGKPFIFFLFWFWEGIENGPFPAVNTPSPLQIKNEKGSL